MKKKLLKYISLCFQTIDSLLVKLHVIRPLVVVAVDGGICSQMIAYLRGQYYAQVGISVYYNLRWFKTSGKDNFGKFDRPFELLEAFPNIKLNELSRLRTSFFQHFLRYEYTNNQLPDRDGLTRSVYLSLYPDFRKDEDFAGLFKKCFVDEAGLVNEKMLNTPKDYVACGIHIRRGDMTNWMAIQDGYFVEAVKYAQGKYKQVKFYFFSDEPEWVKEHIVPELPKVDFEIISGNKGHEDLLLCAQCDVIVSSQGSMGRFASLMNPECELIVPSAKEEVGFPILRYRSGTVLEQFDNNREK